MPASKKVAAEFKTLFDVKVKLGQSRHRREITSQASSAARIAIVLLLVALALGVAAAWWLSRRIQRGVRTIVERLSLLRDNCATDLRNALRAVTGGDLTVAVTATTPELLRESNDEIGDIAEAVETIRLNTVDSIETYNEMRAQLSAMMGELAETAGTVHTRVAGDGVDV